jgi:hypothetical protein
MRHGDPRMRNAHGGHVLLATQFVGGGRSGFLAFDGTWRWRKYGEELFNRFWVQLVRYIAEGKRLGGGKRGTLLTDGDEFAIGEAVAVSARLLNARYEPLKADQLPARYVVEDRATEFTLNARRDQPGWFEGRFVPDRTGACRIVLPLPTDAAGGTNKPGESRELTRDIRVVRPNIEIRKPWMDRAALRTLAEESYGGKYHEIDEASSIPSLIPDLHEEIPVRSRPESLWDNSLVQWSLVLLLGLEWGIRKWKHLL